MLDEEYERLMSGNEIYGDSFTLDQIEEWYKKEEYATLELRDDVDRKQYDALNLEHGFSKLRGPNFGVCLAIGAADGRELECIAEMVSEFIVIEPVEKWWRSDIAGTPSTYLKPNVDGVIDVDSASVDVVLSFGVLHHIPNVSFVINELSRVLRLGGTLIVREPVVAMGDWRISRKGMTPCERGIPKDPLINSVIASGCVVENATPIDCPVVVKIAKFLNIKYPFSHKPIVKLDAVVSRILSWNYCYNPKNVFQKISPASMMLIARKGKAQSCGQLE